MRTGIDIRSIAPLTSWDVFMQGYRRTQQLAEDRYTLAKMAKQWYWKHSFDFGQQLFELQKTILVTLPSQEIVFASSNIYEMNGYQPHEVIGHTPKLFQGAETSLETRNLVKTAVAKVIPFETTIINYRKDGSLYNCLIKGFPLFNRSRQLVHFIAFESVA